jgi:hypothetical protein
MSLDQQRGVWHCPGCQRRVPARMMECRCGAFRAQAVGWTASERSSRSSGSGWLKSILALAASVVVCVAWVRYVWPVMGGSGKASVTVAPGAQAAPVAPAAPTAQAEPPARAVPVAAAPPPQRETPPAWSAAPPRWPAVRVQMSGGGSAAPASTAAREEGHAVVPSTLSEPDQARERGLRQLGAEFNALAGNANRLIALVQRYQASCNSVPTPACEGQLEQIGRLAIAVGAAIERTEDIARTSWLDPGVVRELRVKYGMDDAVWDDIERFTREYRR